jgi:hypothetical protein
MFKMNIKLLERSNIVEHDILGNPVVFQLEFVQMLGENEYYYNFRKVVQEDGEFFDTDLPIIIDSLNTIAEICNQPMKIWDYLYNIYNNKKALKVYIRFRENDIPQAAFSALVNEYSVYDKIIRKFVPGKDDRIIKEEGFDTNDNNPIYEINLWFDHNETIQDKLDFIKHAVDEYENTLKENDNHV